MKHSHIGRTILELLLVVCIVFTVAQSITWNPTTVDDRQIVINPAGAAGNITFKFLPGTVMDKKTVAEGYVVVNDTGFNFSTATDNIVVIVTHIDEDIGSPDYDGDILVSFKIDNNPGNVDFSVSGFTSSVTYRVFKDNISFDDVIAGGADSRVDFEDNPSSNSFYHITLVPGVNTRPVISGEYPSNGTTGVSVDGSPVTFWATDAEGNDMWWEIWDNHTGVWRERASFDVYISEYTAANMSILDNDGDGGFHGLDYIDWFTNGGWQDDGQRGFYLEASPQNNSVTDDWGMTTLYTTYYWSVNITDGLLWTNETFHFTTTGSGNPTVQTNPVSNLEEKNVTMNAEVLNDGGEDCWGYFEWGAAHNPFVNRTENQTGQSTGDSYMQNIIGSNISWYGSNWMYRKKLSIDHNFVDSILYNFPILINDTDSYYSNARSDGYDFLFTDSDSNKIDYDREYYNHGENNLVCWVEVPVVYNDVDTDVYLYWGYGDSEDQQDIEGTWNTSRYTSVYHMDENSGTTMYDSTSNSYDANYSNIYGGNTTRYRDTGGIGYCQLFDGGVYVDYPIQIWGEYMEQNGGMICYTDLDISEDRTQFILCGSDTTGNSHRYIRNYGNTNSFYGMANSTLGWDKDIVQNYNDWSIVGDWVTIGQVYYAWTNIGIDSMSNTGISQYPDSVYGDLYVGRDARPGAPDGILENTYVDEIRFYKDEISNEWFEVETHSINQSTGLIVYGDVTTKYQSEGDLAAGQLYYHRAVVNNTIGSGNGDTIMFLTRPYAPTLLSALTEDMDAITLTWTQLAGSGHNLTYIERINSSYTPWSRGSGYQIYNGTLLTYLDEDLAWGTTYSYQAWSFANWTDNSSTLFQFSIDYDNAENTTNSLPVYTDITPANNSVNDFDTNISINIEDPDGDTFNYSIEIEPQYTLDGYWTGNRSENDCSNKTVICNFNGSHNQTYTWYVNCTDGMDWNNQSFSFTHRVTFVPVPTYGQSKYRTTLKRLHLNWTGHTKADSYIVVQRNSSHVTENNDNFIRLNNTQDDWIRQNNTDNFYNISWTETSGGYFTVFAYNASAEMYSYNWSSLQGVNIPWGALGMHVYNESNPSQSINFNIEISDSQAQNVYYATNLSTPSYIDIYDIPYGQDTVVIISATGYRQRTFYYDFFINNFYNYSWYLPPYTTPSDPGGGDPGGGEEGEGGNYSTTRLYFIQVIDESNQPVEDAEIHIRKYINTSDEYVNLSIVHTDGYGYASVWLIPNSNLKVFVFADGYQDAVSDWTTDPVYYGSSYPKIISLNFEDIEPVEPIIEPEQIQFTGSLVDTNLTLVFFDTLNMTINTQIYIYETNTTTGNTTLFYSDSRSGEYSFTFTVTFNRSNSYIVHLFYNHSAFGGQKRTLIYDAVTIPKDTEEKLDSLLDILIGDNLFGWANLLIFLFIVAAFFYADEKDCSKILILIGGIFLFLNAFFGFGSTLFTIAGGIIPILFIVVGIIMLWNEKKVRG